MHRRWIVLKFGGTSVSTASRWHDIAARVRLHLPTHRVWIVVSALAGVSDRLEDTIAEATDGEASSLPESIRATHRALADALALESPPRSSVEASFDELDTLLGGIRTTREASPRLRARILAIGELASSTLGAAALDAMGIPTRWLDARTLLEAESEPRRQEHDSFLSATVPIRQDVEAADRAAGDAEVVLTQGFIARTPQGDTCLLGRGGSDTSAALFAALVDASSLEIHTDVPGLFTADPRLVPSARLVRRIGYREAREIAAMGAKVIHPRSIEPVARAGIPLSIHSAEDPDGDGTLIDRGADDQPAVMAVTCRLGVTMLTLSTIRMWGASGFLARAFAPFEALGISIDLVATSQAAVSVTLDRIPGGVHGSAFAALVAELQEIGEVKVIHPCAVVSIVGRRIRTALHEIGPALEVFQERRVHMLSDSSADLNLSFVVDEEDARPLVARLHDCLFTSTGTGLRHGPSWEQLRARTVPPPPSRPWWASRRDALLELATDGAARYVYDLPTVRARAESLVRTLESVERAYYSMKANAHPAVIAAVAEAGLGIECVSAAEVRRAIDVVGSDTPITFTPNFCPVDEVRAAFDAGVEVVIDGPEILSGQGDLFAGREIGVRLDPGKGLGHHEKVRTAGARSKFGHPIEEVDALAEAAARAGARIVGLHAHVGSGVLDPSAWATTCRRLAAFLDRFPDVRWINAGGGLGVPERAGQPSLALPELEHLLAEVRRELRREIGSVSLRLEPGRYLVSEAGVLLAPVTQVRRKRNATFIGVATGMNSLLRPALYGAWHGIHNLTRLDEPPGGHAHVVGPICETGDVLGRDRLLPETRPGDVLLVENAGAYGAVMSSRYNLREPAREIVLD